MHNFDELLYKALLDANLLQFQKILEDADSTDPAFSPRYRQTRIRILNDPFAWFRQKRQPIWKKVIRNVACILLACMLTLGTLMTVSQTVRAAVLQWLREISGSEITYHASGEKAGDALPSWRPTWLPEGWVMTDMYSRNSRAWWRFKDSGDSGATLTCACFDPSTQSISTVLNGTDVKQAQTTITVQGYQADYYEGETDTLLVWEDEDGYLFWLSGWMTDRATVERVAESMTYYTDTDTGYEMGWVPEGYEPKTQFKTIGAWQEEWIKNEVTLTWQYVTDTICPWEVPERKPEEVSVMGFPAQYWASQIPEEEVSANTTGDSPFRTWMTYSIEESGVLTWTNSKTNTTFLLKGILDKEDFLRMAESITEKNLSQN